MPDESKPVVIVTGSSGLIGHVVCCRIAAEGFHVYGFDRPGAPHPPEVAENIPCDLTSDQHVRDAFDLVRRERGNRIASVVHLAAYYDFSGEPSDLYEKVTVGGTRRVLDNLHDFDVGQFLFSSTMLVHAPTEPGKPITELWPLEPKWDYPRSKVRTEELILQQRGRVPQVALLRIAGVYNDAGHSIPLAHQMQRIYERWMTSHVFPGDLSHGQAFVHLNDAVESIRLSVLKRADLPAEFPVLIGEDTTLSYDALQREFGLLIHGEEWQTTPIPKTVAKAGAWVQGNVPGMEEPFIKPWMIDIADDHYELDIARARCHLGWSPARALRDTLPLMVQRLKASPAAWYRENELTAPDEHHPVAEVGARAE